MVEWLRHGTYGIALGLFLPIACRLFIVLQLYDQILFFESLISSSSGEEAVLLRFEGGRITMGCPWLGASFNTNCIVNSNYRWHEPFYIQA